MTPWRDYVKAFPWNSWKVKTGFKSVNITVNICDFLQFINISFITQKGRFCSTETEENTRADIKNVNAAVSIFTHNELIWLLCQYSHKINSFDLCQYSPKMNSFDCCVNIHPKWIPLTAVSIFTNIQKIFIYFPLTVVSIFTENEFLWLLCQYSHQMNSFSCQSELLST